MKSRSGLRKTLAATTSVAVAAATLTLAAAPATAVTTWTSPTSIVTAAPDDQLASFSLSFSGDRLAYTLENSTGDVRQAHAVERTGPTAWGSPTAIAPGSNFAWADPVMISGDGSGVAMQYMENNAATDAGAKGNRNVSGSWQAPGSFTSFSNGDYVDSVTISEDADRVAWRQSGAVKTASWAADGTPGAAAEVASDGSSPVVVGDGSGIAYIREDGEGNDQVFLARGSGSSWTDEQVTTGGATFVYGTSADGNQIIFMSANQQYEFHAARKVGSTWVIQTFGGAQAEDNNGYYDVAADGSFGWKEVGGQEAMVTQFRNGVWQAPVELAASANAVELSDNGQVMAYVEADSDVVEIRSWTPTGWEPAVSLAGTFPAELELADDGCSVAYIIGTTESFFSRMEQACSPLAPTAVQAGASSATVTWEPGYEGLNPTTSYEVQAMLNGEPVDGATCTVSAPLPDPLSCVVPGLENGNTYTFIVAATTSDGQGPWSGPSNEVAFSGSTVRKPNKPRALKVTGGPSASRYVASWRAPVNPGDRPVTAYRLRLNQVGVAKAILRKRLSSATRSYTFTRAFLLKNSKRVRGDISGNRLRFVVRVEALNSAGGGPISVARFIVKI